MKPSSPISHLTFFAGQRLAWALVCLVLGGIPVSKGEAGTGGEAAAFNFKVRPILAEHCFECHGSDERARKGKLRLDLESAARASGVLAKAEGKEAKLLEHIFSTDPEEVMPPPETHQTLTGAEKETLRLWVTSGASYARHWAFEPPQRAVVPTMPGLTNEIDAFVLDALRGKGLEFARRRRNRPGCGG